VGARPARVGTGVDIHKPPQEPACLLVVARVPLRTAMNIRGVVACRRRQRPARRGRRSRTPGCLRRTRTRGVGARVASGRFQQWSSLPDRLRRPSNNRSAQGGEGLRGPGSVVGLQARPHLPRQPSRVNQSGCLSTQQEQSDRDCRNAEDDHSTRRLSAPVALSNGFELVSKHCLVCTPSHALCPGDSLRQAPLRRLTQICLSHGRHPSRRETWAVNANTPRRPPPHKPHIVS
jgi:hypothetical protein